MVKNHLSEFITKDEGSKYQQTFQLSRILRETHAFDIFLTHAHTLFSHAKAKK